MKNSIKNFIEEGEKELILKIELLEPDGFNIVSPSSDNGYYLDEDKTKEWYRSRQISLIKMIVEMTSEEKRKEAHPPIPEIKGDSWRMGYNQGLATISSKLKELI